MLLCFVFLTKSSGIDRGEEDCSSEQSRPHDSREVTAS